MVLAFGSSTLNILHRISFGVSNTYFKILFHFFYQDLPFSYSFFFSLYLFLILNVDEVTLCFYPHFLIHFRVVFVSPCSSVFHFSLCLEQGWRKQFSKEVWRGPSVFVSKIEATTGLELPLTPLQRSSPKPLTSWTLPQPQSAKGVRGGGACPSPTF